MVSAPVNTAPKPVHLNVEKGASEKVEVAAPTPKPEHRREFKLGVSVAVALLVLVVGVAIFFGWRHFRPTENPVAVAPSKTAAPEAGAKGQSEPATAGKPPIPDTMAKLRETAANQRVQEQARVDALAVGADPSEKSPRPASGGLPMPPSEKSEPPPVVETAEAPVSLAPGVTALAPGVTVSDASPAFRSFVANVKITGVFQGDTPRAIINGRTLRVGEFVNAAMGISFDSIDAEKKQIVFRDNNGVTVARKY